VSIVCSVVAPSCGSIYINKIRHDLSCGCETNVNKHICVYMCICMENRIPSSLLGLPRDVLIKHDVMIDVHPQDN
jgi:hypothetical protein